jgi:hypothetical protein
MMQPFWFADPTIPLMHNTSILGSAEGLDIHNAMCMGVLHNGKTGFLTTSVVFPELFHEHSVLIPMFYFLLFFVISCICICLHNRGSTICHEQQDPFN